MDREILSQARFWYPFLIEKKTPREILEQNPEVRKLGWVIDDNYVGDRHYRFHHQLADRNTTEAWARVAATPLPIGAKDPSSKASAERVYPRVLTIWGTSDWMVDKAGNAWICALILMSLCEVVARTLILVGRVYGSPRQILQQTNLIAAR